MIVRDSPVNRIPGSRVFGAAKVAVNGFALVFCVSGPDPDI